MLVPRLENNLQQQMWQLRHMRQHMMCRRRLLRRRGKCMRPPPPPPSEPPPPAASSSASASSGAYAPPPTPPGCTWGIIGPAPVAEPCGPIILPRFDGWVPIDAVARAISASSTDIRHIVSTSLFNYVHRFETLVASSFATELIRSKPVLAVVAPPVTPPAVRHRGGGGGG